MANTNRDEVGSLNDFRDLQIVLPHKIARRGARPCGIFYSTVLYRMNTLETQLVSDFRRRNMALVKGDRTVHVTILALLTLGRRSV